MPKDVKLTLQDGVNTPRIWYNPWKLFFDSIVSTSGDGPTTF